MPKRLTKEDYQMIKGLLDKMNPTEIKKSVGITKGISVIHKINNTKDFEDYKEQVYKNYKRPTLWDKIKNVFTIHER